MTEGELLLNRMSCISPASLLFISIHLTIHLDGLSRSKAHLVLKWGGDTNGFTIHLFEMQKTRGKKKICSGFWMSHQHCLDSELMCCFLCIQHLLSSILVCIPKIWQMRSKPFVNKMLGHMEICRGKWTYSWICEVVLYCMRLSFHPSILTCSKASSYSQTCDLRTKLDVTYMCV